MAKLVKAAASKSVGICHCGFESRSRHHICRDGGTGRRIGFKYRTTTGSIPVPCTIIKIKRNKRWLNVQAEYLFYDADI